ncbi:hypothetical protein O1611_g10170 [Lasiodiplodia mahajangana]|uniref:Uncharacterized protein n=1 Tax=Lasiodiplodia mahajangana TaxID=1108764 RepID=A0ACC2J144_9PEZI|nr:hypothetical protein O1611_g10170 [Lasiodiplodia mahajangana]
MILPEVMELLLAHSGLLTNEMLVAGLKKAAAEGMSLDEVVENMERENPEIKRAHQVYLESAQDDQDYQRLLTGLTTDEMIHHNVHTMANDAVMELDNPIHPLFDRPAWDNCEWKGHTPELPRMVYSINGVREEWNVTTNDALWDALKPAMRLLSKVFSKRPPVLEALMDMTTRQPLPPESDGRLSPDTPTLVKYVLQEDADLSLTYPAIRRLHEVHKYDWRGNVLRVLADILVLDIDWGFDLGRESGKENLADDSHAHFTYGSTGYYSKAKRIRIRIAGELIWPLLVPQYSASEKLVCSFTIATVLLHEFAHAVSAAHEVLTSRDWAQPQNQDPEITRLLHSLEGELFNSDQIEPFFEDYPQDELGRDLEHSLWGCSSNLTGLWLRYPRHIMPLPIALGTESFPSGEGWWRADAPGPAVIYVRPFPVDYVTKLFRKSFWDEEFEAYGFPALKLRPDDTPHMVIVQGPKGSTGKTDRETYGRDVGAFLWGVIDILLSSRQRLLGTYLRALKLEVVYGKQWLDWWKHEIENWDDDVLSPLAASVETLRGELRQAEAISTAYHANDQFAEYAQWCSGRAQGNLMPFDAWKKEVADNWRGFYRYGGWLMQRLLAVHNHMHDDLGVLQLMVFHFLSVKPESLTFTLGGGTPLPRSIARIYKRLFTFLNHAEQLVVLTGNVARQPSLVDVQDKWLQWQARFQSNVDQYTELVTLFSEGMRSPGSWFNTEHKARFDRLPSAGWKHLSERYKKAAYREYIRAPAARAG